MVWLIICVCLFKNVPLCFAHMLNCSCSQQVTVSNTMSTIESWSQQPSSFQPRYLESNNVTMISRYYSCSVYSVPKCEVAQKPLLFEVYSLSNSPSASWLGFPHVSLWYPEHTLRTFLLIYFSWHWGWRLQFWWRLCRRSAAPQHTSHFNTLRDLFSVQFSICSCVSSQQRLSQCHR